MATMLNGAAVMDACVLLVAANETCPQPQTAEHLAAVEIMKMKHILIVQNKIDLIRSKKAALEQQNDIRNFVQRTVAQSSPIIPVTAQLGINIDSLLEHICCNIPIPKRLLTQVKTKMIVIRSFDVNKPGVE